MAVIDDDALKLAIYKWEETVSIKEAFNTVALKAHLLEEWGIKVDGGFNNWGVTIVDESKYMMFLLKFR